LKSIVLRIRGMLERRFATPRRVSLREAVASEKRSGKHAQWTTAPTSAASRAAVLPMVKVVTVRDEGNNAHHALIDRHGRVIELRGNGCLPQHLSQADVATPRTISQGIWIAEDWQGNYYHWLVRHLPKLMLFEGVDAPLVLPAHCGMQAVIDDTLDVLGWPRERRLYVDSPVTVIERGHICQLADPDPQLVREVADRLRLSSNAGIRSAVFISRGAAASRRILNEPSLIERLEETGVRAVRFEGARFQQQRELMSGVTLLVGMHGAGLTNMMLMPAGGAVIEVMAGPAGGATLYETLSRCLGHRYLRIPATAQDANDRNSDVHVDIEEVVRDVKRLDNLSQRDSST